MDLCQHVLDNPGLVSFLYTGSGIEELVRKVDAQLR